LSNVLTAEQMPGAQRWQLPAFGAAAAPHAVLHTAAQLDAMDRAAFEEGFARGRAEGLAAGAAEARAATQRLRKLFEHCAKPLDELDGEVETAMVEVAVRAARRLVQRESQLDPALLAGAVREALAGLAGAPRELRVHLHPEDLKLLHDQLERPEGASSWRLVPDHALQRGDCRIEGESGWIDATLATAEKALLRVLGAERESA
jgi:flagellar assembly protein FliH